MPQISRSNNVDIGYAPNLSPEEQQDVMIGSKLILAARCIFVTYLMLMKLCLLFYFERMTTYTKELWMIRGAGFILFITWSTGILTIFIECHPLRLFWAISDEPPECAKTVTAVMVNSATDIATTIILMALPLPIIMRYHFRTSVPLVFGAGYLMATFMLIMPMVQLVTVLNQSPIRDLLWRQLNVFAATVLANWPILCKLWPHAYGHIRSGKFGRDGCDQPKLRIVKTFAEDQPFINDVNKEDLTTTIATKKVVHLLAIIAQILKLRRKLSHDAQAQNHATTRTSFPLSPLTQTRMKNPYETDLEIGASVAFLQESHPGQMDPMQTTPGPCGMEDIYVGGGHGQGPIGYVSTDITSQASQASTIMSKLKPVHSWHVKDKLKRVLERSRADTDGINRTSTA